jgi:NhaP-type Na+/H+ or K+/H+ antiporter
MLEIGRRLDLRWLGHHRDLLRAALGEITLSFTAIFLFAWGVVGLMAAWAAAAAAVTMASAPAVVLLTVEESSAQGQVTERIILHTALSAAASFVVFAVVVGVVHAQYSDDWLNAVMHPLWVVVGALIIAWLMALLALWSRPCCRNARWHRSSSSWPRPCSPLAPPACWRCRFF